MSTQTLRGKTFFAASVIFSFLFAGYLAAQEASAPPSGEPPPLTGGLYPEVDAAVADALAALRQKNAEEDEYSKNPSAENRQRRDAARAEDRRKYALARFRVGQFVLLTKEGERWKLNWAGDHVETLVRTPSGSFWEPVQIRSNGDVLRGVQTIGSLDRDSAKPPPRWMTEPAPGPRMGRIPQRKAPGERNTREEPDRDLKTQPMTPETETPKEGPAVEPETKTKPKPPLPEGEPEPKAGGSSPAPAKPPSSGESPKSPPAGPEETSAPPGGTSPPPGPGASPDCVKPGSTARVTGRVEKHSDNHHHSFCEMVAGTFFSLMFGNVSGNVFDVTLDGLIPTPLNCSTMCRVCSGSCDATVPDLAGHQNVKVEIQDLRFADRTVEGKLVFRFPGEPFVVRFAGPLQGP